MLLAPASVVNKLKTLSFHKYVRQMAYIMVDHSSALQTQGNWDMFYNRALADTGDH